ncbi:MAG: peptidase S41 [Fluviicola sp. XM-24bin1]|nr:MAG: peptidase S41 [Fluviicola sp. XM-24bin1]
MEKENRSKTYLIPLIVSVSLAIGLLIGGRLNPAPSEEQFSYQGSHTRKLQDIMHLIDKKYVDSVDVEELFEATVTDMLHRLDPHSNYIPADELKALNEGIKGEFGGVGIRFFIIRDTVCVTNVVKGSPSEDSGLKSGDKIIKVNGKNIASNGITNDKVQKLLKGTRGTDVKVQLWRNGKKLNKTITRGSIPLNSVTASYMIDSKTGFIRIASFSQNTALEFRSAAARLKKAGMKKLVLDLRGNPGGVLSAAVNIADEFLRGGLKIVETKGKNVRDEVYRSTSNGILKETEVAVLINSNSASASEILAGAIQDNDRGTIVGRRSFGKGLVQQDTKLRDGSNIRLTIARYYTPLGRCVQRPYAEGNEAYLNDLSERMDNGELYEVDSSIFVDSLKFVTKKGKVVYGGGGIMPDVFVPFDSTGGSWYYTRLQVSPVFNAFAFDYVSNKRKKWKDAKHFARTFVVTESILQQFANFAAEEYGIAKDSEGLRASKTRIKQTIKSEIARQLWLEEGVFIVRDDYDTEVIQALRELK